MGFGCEVWIVNTHGNNQISFLKIKISTNNTESILMVIAHDGKDCSHIRNYFYFYFSIYGPSDPNDNSNDNCIDLVNSQQ